MRNANAKGDARRGHTIFELIGGNPALDLVNTLDWRFRQDPPPEELLTDYDDVVQFSAQCGLIHDSTARRLTRNVGPAKSLRIVEAVRELREAASQLLYAALERRDPAPASVTKLESYFREARKSQHLGWTGDKLAWESNFSAAPPELPLWILSLRVENLLTSEVMEKLRSCGNDDCRWLFLDTSKNHTRRWCDMKICGNRIKARRFKAQHRG